MEEKIKQHVNRWHKGVTKYQCTECGKYLKNKDYLDTHMTQHYNLQDKRQNFQLCSYQGCTQLFATKLAKQKHEKEIHEDNMKEKCSFCTKEFSVSRYRVAHEKVCPYNPDRKEFECRWCGQVYYTLAMLNRHAKNKHG